MKQKLTAVADNVIATYRDNETQQVRDGDWKRAHAWLAKALIADPGDDAIRGKLASRRGTSPASTAPSTRTRVSSTRPPPSSMKRSD